jgi:hypothetical protein
MFNSESPSRMALPSSRQLVRSTLIALVSAVVLLVTVVLPSEYGIDATGAGRLLGLTEMGEIKMQLAAEAAAEAAADTAGSQTAGGTAAASGSEQASAAATAVAEPAAEASPTSSPAPAPAASPQLPWRDETRFTLAPGEGIEIKLRMNEGARAEFAWAVTGGVVNYDTHGDGGGRSISYVKGRGVPSDEGELVAAFTGNHGWFWRNRGQAGVAVVLRTRGDYLSVQRAK